VNANGCGQVRTRVGKTLAGAGAAAAEAAATAQAATMAAADTPTPFSHLTSTSGSRLVVYPPPLPLLYFLKILFCTSNIDFFMQKPVGTKETAGFV
jgi:hypothetical protein